jgi:3-isopropylmalate/(R)-2-methylmalate dehydratase small subunit
MTVELSSNAVTGPTSSIYPFSLDATRREALLAGADGIATPLKKLDAIKGLERSDRLARPWVWE